MASVTGFLLTRHWRDGPHGVEMVFRGQQAVCFMPADTAPDPADLPDLRLE